MAYGVVILADGERGEDLMGVSLVEVHERVGAPTTYYLRYPIHTVEGDLVPLKESRLAPGADLAVFQRATGFNDCLVKGQVFSHQIRLLHGVEGSMLEVVGADSSLKLDRETKITQWADNTSDSDAVSQIVGGYELIPDVEDTDTRHMEDKRTLIQHDTDLNFIRMLAQRNGFLFWVRCDAELTETAYFKPPPLEDPDAPTLTINLENPTMDTLDITWDVERPTTVIANAYDGAVKEAIDGSGVPLPPLFSGDVPLNAIATDTRSTSVIAAVADVGDLMGRASGVLLDSSWFIQASCVVNVATLGKVIHAHSVVNLDGVGTRYSGTYFVSGVRHIIDDAKHLMELTLVRNGWRA